MSYKAKLMIVLISLAVIPILVANLISYSYSSSALEGLVRSESRTIVHKLKYEMEELHSNAVFNLAGISRMQMIRQSVTPSPTAEQRQRIEKFLRGMLATNRIFESYQMISMKGNQIYKVYRDKNMKKTYFADMTDRQYFQKAISTRKPFISDILISKATRRPIVIIGHPIMDERGTVIGVLSAIINYQVIISLITELRSTPGAHPFITSRDGLIIAHVDTRLVARKNFLKIAEMSAGDRKAFLGKGAGFFAYSRNNERRFLYFSANKTGKYKLCYSIPRAGFFKAIDRLMYIIFFVVAIVSVLSTVLALVISKKVSDAMNTARIASAEARQKNEELEGLAAKLAKYLSPQLYQSIFTGGKDVKIETYRKKLTVFFSDIKDFSVITDSMQSEALSSILNEYLNEMSKIVLKYGGTIDKFIGDAIMVFFGDPESKGEEQDAIACVSMAVEMRDTMHALQELWASMGISRPMKIRIGINSGYCTIGNFGSNQKLEYTIIGGEVNLASRLESAAEVDCILISHETYGLVKDRVECVPMGEITVKGIAHSVKTYQVVGFSDASIDRKQISVKTDGFALSIDLARQKNKEETINQLKDVIKQIKDA